MTAKQCACGDYHEPEHPHFGGTLGEFFSAYCDWCRIEVRNPVEPPHMVKLVAEPLPGDVTEWHIDLECYSFLLRLISHLAIDRTGAQG